MQSKKDEIVACLMEYPKRDSRKISFISLKDGVCTLDTNCGVNFASEEARKMFDEFPTLFAYVIKEMPRIYASDYERTLKWYDVLGKMGIRKFSKTAAQAETKDVLPLCEAEEVCVETGNSILFIKNKLYTPFCVLWNGKDASFQNGVESKAEKIRKVMEELCSDVGVSNLSDLKRVKAELPTNDVIFHGLEW